MSESKPEDKGLKDENYNDTKKKDDPTAGKKEICGFVAIPGLEFRSKQVFASCSKCQATGLTDVDAFWSVKNYLCCYYCNCYWKCRQQIQGKDYTLKDAVHKCSSCKEVLANYQAC
mmetsp:Transcript_35226/g.36631  ORF Transcript_35226/g.36631 Transcript_35226/m.36631 type:complete len:116 (-) Transcript_35226:128-475(-)